MRAVGLLFANDVCVCVCVSVIPTTPRPNKQYTMLREEKARLTDELATMQDALQRSAKGKETIKRLKAEIKTTKRADKTLQARTWYSEYE